LKGQEKQEVERLEKIKREMKDKFKRSMDIRHEYDILDFQKEIDKAKYPGGAVLRIIFLGRGSDRTKNWMAED
jgi:hypothetical protein